MSKKQDSPSCPQLSFEFSDDIRESNSSAAQYQCAPLRNEHEPPVQSAKVYFLPLAPSSLISAHRNSEAHAIQRLIARAKSLSW